MDKTELKPVRHLKPVAVAAIVAYLAFAVFYAILAYSLWSAELFNRKFLLLGCAAILYFIILFSKPIGSNKLLHLDNYWSYYLFAGFCTYLIYLVIGLYVVFMYKMLTTSFLTAILLAEKIVNNKAFDWILYYHGTAYFLIAAVYYLVGSTHRRVPADKAVILGGLLYESQDHYLESLLYKYEKIILERNTRGVQSDENEYLINLEGLDFGFQTINLNKGETKNSTKIAPRLGIIFRSASINYAELVGEISKIMQDKIKVLISTYGYADAIDKICYPGGDKFSVLGHDLRWLRSDMKIEIETRSN